MADLRKQARTAIKKGFRVIPVSALKNPTIQSWKRYQYEEMPNSVIEKSFRSAWGMALLMGGPEGLIALDFDLKYDLSGTVMDRFKEYVGEELFNKCYLQETMSGGYHLVFKCKDRCKNNRKLAVRKTTSIERHEIYMKYWNDPKTRDQASGAGYQDKYRVLIETREEGGYILIPPSGGYTYIQGNMVELTPSEVDILFESAYRINEVKNEASVYNPSKLSKQTQNLKWNTNPYDDFNANFDLVNELITEFGWELVENGPKDVRLRRPLATSKDSAVFDKDSRRFTVFSTSTPFATNTTYSCVDAMAVLLFEGDTIQMFNYMIENEYGK